jgi:hypothetical protein
MKRAAVTETVNTGYKAGYVQCACGWRKELGDGFDGYHIANCPECTSELHTRDQRKVTTGRPVGHGLTVSLGRHIYFVMDNGIHIQFSKQPHTVLRNLTERQADAL